MIRMSLIWVFNDLGDAVDTFTAALLEHKRDIDYNDALLFTTGHEHERLYNKTSFTGSPFR